MSHSLKYQYIHLLWATKNLQHLITEDSKSSLLGYLYGVFSVGKPAIEVVSNYVENQENHHNTNSFEQEWNWLRSMNYTAQ
jgi:hypothetical protein